MTLRCLLSRSRSSWWTQGLGGNLRGPARDALTCSCLVPRDTLRVRCLGWAEVSPCPWRTSGVTGSEYMYEYSGIRYVAALVSWQGDTGITPWPTIPFIQSQCCSTQTTASRREFLPR